MGIEKEDYWKDLAAVGKFCIEPRVQGLEGTQLLFRVIPEGCSLSYVGVERIGSGCMLRIQRSLVKDFRRLELADPEANYNGVLELRQQCHVAPGGFIEPSGSRQ